MKKIRSLTIIGALSVLFLTSCDIFGGGNSSSTSTSTSTSSSSSSSSTNPNYNFGTKLNVPRQSGSFKIPNSSITINESGYYTSKEEVAAYILAFKKKPSNFMIASKRNDCKDKFGSLCMLYGTETHGNKEGLLPPSFRYIEMDLYYGDKGYGSNRGSLRLVATLGNSDSKNDAVYYTAEHYESYSEYLGYYSGWSSVWEYSYTNKPAQTVGNAVKIGNNVITLSRKNVNSIISYFKSSLKQENNSLNSQQNTSN